MTKNQTGRRHANHRQTFKASLILLLLVVCTASAAAQDQTQSPPSTDRDNPTPLTANVITGDGVDDKTEYFYSLAAGPGEVNVALDVKAEKGTAVSSVDIALFDAKSNKLLSTYANPDHGGSKHAIESAKVRGTQTLLLEVTVSQGVDNFRVKLGGAIKLAPSTDGGTAGPDSTAPPADASSQQETPRPMPLLRSAAMAASKSGEARSVPSAARQNAPQARPFARPTSGGITAALPPAAVGASVRPQIVIRREKLLTPKRVAVAVSVTNWRDFAGKFSAERLPKTLPPSPCDQSAGVRVVVAVYNSGGQIACSNVASTRDLALLRTSVPLDQLHDVFYVVLTNLAEGKSVRSNTARIDSQ